MKFNDIIKDGGKDADFIIQNPDTRLLAARSSFFIELSILGAELHATWVNIIYAR